jgi:hypothetical protein
MVCFERTEEKHENLSPDTWHAKNSRYVINYLTTTRHLLTATTTGKFYFTQPFINLIILTIVIMNVVCRKHVSREWD